MQYDNIQTIWLINEKILKFSTRFRHVNIYHHWLKQKKTKSIKRKINIYWRNINKEIIKNIITIKTWKVYKNNEIDWYFRTINHEIKTNEKNSKIHQLKTLFNFLSI